MASQKAVGLHLDLSQAAVSQLVSAGVFRAHGGRGTLNLDECRVAYVRHLREMAAGRAPAAEGDEPLDLVTERARLARAQAEAQERKNRKEEGELVEVEVAKSVMFDCARQARDAWIGWPARVGPMMAVDLGLEPGRVIEALHEHVHQQLVELGEPDGEGFEHGG